MRTQPALGEINLAEFSPCGRYRYNLTRIWDVKLSVIPNLACWLMLNPSTADAMRNDPTVEGVERRSREWGFDGFIVVNLFALRATDPAEMLAHHEPVGPKNDTAIAEAVSKSAVTICAWGTKGKHLGRSEHVLSLLAGRELYCLRRNADGSPEHPLYIPRAIHPVRWL